MMRLAIARTLGTFICGLVLGVGIITTLFQVRFNNQSNVEYVMMEKTNIDFMGNQNANNEQKREENTGNDPLKNDEKVLLKYDGSSELIKDKRDSIIINKEINIIKRPSVGLSSGVMKSFVDMYAKDEQYIAPEDTDTWNLAKHYNIDDYGVPIEEYTLSVSYLKGLSLSERLNIIKERNIKTVLYMHTAYGAKTYGFNYDDEKKQGQLPYIMKGCRRRDCFCTHDRSVLPMEEFDAIVFYSRGISQSDRPKVRKQNQRYILWEVEPPLYLFSFQPKQWNNFFNWTHTYRRDSDFWEPWGMINQHKPFPKSIDEMISDKAKDPLPLTKTKSVAWFVSNCSPRSGRDKFIKELQKYITVDVYGACGPLKCSRGNHDECWRMVEKDYFFYFAAENSLCKDYVTEKFFNTLKKNVVPIAFGGGSGSNDYYFMPKKSYINALDFKSPKELADFLLKLQNDITEYKSYFWWKPYYNIWLGRWKKAHCEICDQLHENDKPKVYKDMNEWWVTESKCRAPWR